MHTHMQFHLEWYSICIPLLWLQRAVEETSRHPGESAQDYHPSEELLDQTFYLTMKLYKCS